MSKWSLELPETEEREQAVPGGMRVERPISATDLEFSERDPGMARAVEDVLAGLRNDMIPPALQMELFEAMGAAVQRDAIGRASGLDASILATFKQQLHLVESILRRTFNEDGSLVRDAEDLGIEPKDVLNLSLKINQMMIKDLPKVYNMERIQKMETAIYEVMSNHMDREAQERFLLELDKRRNGL